MVNTNDKSMSAARAAGRTAPTEEGGPRARAVLSLDGGGVRGTITVAFLRRLETLLRERDGLPDARFCDYFDLIGGTSTGAIISTALSLGYTAAEITDFYHELAPRIFRRSYWRIIGWQPVFSAKNLKEEITRVCGTRTLDTEDLLTYLAIVTKRMDTGSAWVLSNNPASKFWNTPEDGSFIGNRHYPLRELVRASTAAPHYFNPEPVSVIADEPPGLFVDGGVTPYNNPALLLAQMALVPAYGFDWDPGEDNLLIVSVGTGSFRERLDALRAARMSAVGLAVKALSGMISDGEAQTLALMQLLGRTDTPWVVNSEIGDLADAALTPAPLFTFQRYDVRLEADWLREHTGLQFSDRAIEQARKMEDPDGIPLCREIGEAAAERFVQAGHIEKLRRKRKTVDIPAT